MAKYVDKFILDEEEILIRDNVLFNEYIVVIGDSYAQGWDGTQLVTGWAEKMCQYLGRTLNDNLFINAEGSCGFYATNTSGHNFQNLLELQAQNMTEEQKEKVTMVLVGGGHNDTYDGTISNINQGISNFINKQKELFPNAKTLIAYIGSTLNVNTWKKNTIVLPTYKDCGKFGGGYVSNSENILYNKSWINSDKIHFNQNGYDFIGMQMANYIKSGNISIQAHDTITFTGIEGVSIVNLGNEGIIFYNDSNIYLLDDDLRINFPNNITLSWNTFTPIANYNSNILKEPAFGINFTTTALVQDTNNTWQWVPIYLRFDDKLRLKMGNPNGGLNYTIKDINIIPLLGLSSLPNSYL